MRWPFSYPRTVPTHQDMTRSELIAELAARHPHLHLADAERIVLTVFDQISNALAHGQRVELRRFGVFTVKRRNARVTQNPRTGAAVSVDEKTWPHFRPSRALQARVNGKRWQVR